MPSYISTKKTPSISYETIIKDVREGKILPIYYLMGEESYYIDRLSEFLVDSLLTKDEQGFDLITFFGAETDMEQVIMAAKGYPIMAKFSVVLVKEAQALSHLDKLEFYLKQPQKTTVVIFCHKNGNIDRRLKVAGMIEKCGVLYESKKVGEGHLPVFVKNYLKRKQIAVEPEAAALIGEYVGSDLNRMAGELDKLILSLKEGERKIAIQHVKMHVGETKEFGIFELQDALAKKNANLAFKIAKYFDKNPKEYPIQKTLPLLFKFFSNLMMAYYAPDKSKRGISSWVGISEWQAERSVIPAMSNYTGVKVMNILSRIREIDAKSKGVDNVNTSNGELMRELIFFILN